MSEQDSSATETGQKKKIRWGLLLPIVLVVVVVVIVVIVLLASGGSHSPGPLAPQSPPTTSGIGGLQTGSNAPGTGSG